MGPSAESRLGPADENDESRPSRMGGGHLPTNDPLFGLKKVGVFIESSQQPNIVLLPRFVAPAVSFQEDEWLLRDPI